MRISDWSSDVCSSDLALAPPAAAGRVEDAHLSALPLADPDPAAAVGPDAAGALAGGRRLDHGGVARLRIDPGDVAAGERGIIDRPVRGDRDAVRPAPLGRVPDAHGAGRGIRSEEHTSELQSLMRISYAVFC